MITGDQMIDDLESWHHAFFGGPAPQRTNQPAAPVETDGSAPLFAYHGGMHAIMVSAELLGGPAGQFAPIPIDGLRKHRLASKVQKSDGAFADIEERWQINENEIARSLPRLDPSPLLNGGNMRAAVRRSTRQ